MKRSALLLSTLLSALSVTPMLAVAQVYVVPAPRARYEAIPAPRRGYAWHPGYWRWGRGAYVWSPGVWVQVVPPPYGYQQVVVEQAPMPPPPPPRVERLSADALFPFDRGSINDIRPQGMAEIAQIAARLRAQPFGHIEVRGYTDRLGGDAYNLNLSQRRAEAVTEALVQQGVPAGKIRPVGYGNSDPVVQCNNADQQALIHCLQPNRRVELVTYLRD